MQGVRRRKARELVRAGAMRTAPRTGSESLASRSRRSMLMGVTF